MKGDIFATFIISFLLAVILIPINILIFKRLNYRQYIREEGPSSHMKKSGTPTMGGIGIILSIFISITIYANIDSNYIFFCLSLMGFGLIGFIDDFIKVSLKRNLGFKAYQKILGQVLFSSVIVFFYAFNNTNYSQLVVPFTDGSIDIGIFYIPFAIFVILGLVNSVNLTDGLDGLSSGITIIVTLTLAYILYNNFASINYNSVIYSISSAGATLGFLIYNKYPARIFMGDVGSLALGGALSYIFLVNKLLLVIPILGGVYFLESLSVIIQVVSYKTRKKRVFLMSPIHHHFEELGWKETKVVKVFVFAGVMLSIVTIIGL
ncbi:MAG: phospho-N-acetylmuramoyl-pentapeptide-transferase [Eubacteriales bacterium]